VVETTNTEKCLVFLKVRNLKPNLIHENLPKVCVQDTVDARSVLRNKDAAAGVAALPDKLQSGRTCTAVMRYNIRRVDKITFGDCRVTTDGMCSSYPSLKEV
jgi:hypothetical protein